MSGLKKSNIPTTIFPQDKTSEHVEHPVDNGRRASEPHLADEDDVDSREKKVIIVRFEDNDPENPENWSNIRKWVTTILLCLMTLFIGLATSAYSVGINDMTAEFGVSAEVGQVGMFVFNASFALVPLFLAPLSEYIGRSKSYLHFVTSTYQLHQILSISLTTHVSSLSSSNLVSHKISGLLSLVDSSPVALVLLVLQWSVVRSPIFGEPTSVQVLCHCSHGLLFSVPLPLQFTPVG